jgi:fatty acid desaturase
LDSATHAEVQKNNDLLFGRNCAAAFAFARVLAGATVVTGLAAAITFAGVLAFAVMLCGLGLLRWCVVGHEFGSRDHTSGNRPESDSKFSAIH